MLKNVAGNISLFSSRELLKGALAKNSPIMRISHTSQNQVSLSIEKQLSLSLCQMFHVLQGPAKLQASKCLKLLELAHVFSRTCKLKVTTWWRHVSSHKTGNVPVCVLFFETDVSRKAVWSNFSCQLAKLIQVCGQRRKYFFFSFFFLYYIYSFICINKTTWQKYPLQLVPT